MAALPRSIVERIEGLRWKAALLWSSEPLRHLDVE